jgi:hypothetical protein
MKIDMILTHPCNEGEVAGRLAKGADEIVLRYQRSGVEGFEIVEWPIRTSRGYEAQNFHLLGDKDVKKFESHKRLSPTHAL